MPDVQRRGFPVVLSAASGTGKTTLSHLLLNGDPDLQLSISFTTRQPRGREVDGVDYHFTDDRAFREMIAAGGFVEWAEVHGNLYGSSRAWTEQRLAKGVDVVFDIDVQGGRQIKAAFPDAVLLFILPPSLEELERRLRDRGTDTEAVIEKRLRAAREEIEAGIDEYDYLIVNDRLESALFDLTAIVRTHRLRKYSRESVKRALLG